MDALRSAKSLYSWLYGSFTLPENDTQKGQHYVSELVFSTWMAFRGNTRDLGSFGEETDEITDLHQSLEEVLLTERGDSDASIKRRRRDLSGDGVWTLATTSQRSRNPAFVCIAVDTSKETTSPSITTKVRTAQGISLSWSRQSLLPQYVPSTSDRHLIELENQVQCLMEAHLAPTQPTQVKKITTSYEIGSDPHDTQYCIEDPEQAFVKYASLRTDEAGGALPSDTVKNPKLSTSLVLSARSYPTIDPQCSSYPSTSINAIKAHSKERNISMCR
ncbi:hypothetical protein Tco_0871634 [Tanacetum coccineum]